MALNTTTRLFARAAILAAIAPSAGRAQAPAKWRLEPIATIEGVSDADPFATIRNLALHADGRLVVVDEKLKQVSMFDVSGKSLGVVGRIGGGPGEYRDPYAAAWLAEPNVVAVGGSWLCPAADIRSGNWDGITAMCELAMKLLKPA